MGFPDSVTVIKEFKFDAKKASVSNENFELYGSVYPYIFETNPSASKSRQVLVTGHNLEAKLYISTNQQSSSKVC